MNIGDKNYKYSINVKNDDMLRRSFNELTKKTYCFDFVHWYESGHWGELYIPHVILHEDKVISNISVNLMQFDVCGVKKNYIQLGTVMTDMAYRGQGLNGKIMEHILKEYEGKVHGIYLFGNDSVLNYYPKFGFKPSKEYEYYMPCNHKDNIRPYVIEKVDMTQNCQCERLYDVIRNYSNDSENLNENDGMYMSDNLGLYQFWIDAGLGDYIYYLPEMGAYVAANMDGQVLYIQQIIGKQHVEMDRLAKSFGENVHEVVLGYTPAHKEHFQVRERKEEDCTLFILGEDLNCMEKNKMMFPVLSHA